jgi:hypothetical protein
MAQNYHYLVTALPDMIEGGGKGFAYSKIRQEIIEELDDEDVPLMKLLLLQFDNANILNFLNKKQAAAGALSYDSRGWYSQGEMEEALADFDTLPEYLQTFIENFKDGKDSVVGIGILEQLYHLYYSEISEKNDWFAEWSDFSADLQNVIAASNARELGVSPEKSVIPFNDNAEKIAKSRAADFGLGGSVSWIEQITKNIAEPIALEEAIDGIYWKKVDELADGKHFGIENVLGIMVKANSIERWLRLDTEKGIARANDLIEKLKLSVQKK